MNTYINTLPPFLVLDPLLQSWLMEDIGRGDVTTQSLFINQATSKSAKWLAKAPGVVAGLPVAARIFQLLNNKVEFISIVSDGTLCTPGQIIAEIHGSFDSLLMGERVALNLAMRLSGIATLTHEYVMKIADLPTRFVDTRKTTPGLRTLEKYASAVGGAINHRMGLDDTVMIKDNHIVAAGGITPAITKIRASIPYTLNIEVETETLEQVQEALDCSVDIIMLDNMPIEMMTQAVKLIRQRDAKVKIEASGNVSLTTIRQIAETGVDYISSSAPITQSKWLDISMRM